MSGISENLTCLIQTPAYFRNKIPRVVDLDKFTVPEDSEWDAPLFSAKKQIFSIKVTENYRPVC